MSPLAGVGRLRRSLPWLLLLVVAVAGCSKSRNDVLFTPGVGHPEDWIADHGKAYRKAPARCVECHGTDLKGGVSAVSCFSASFKGTACHPGGPATFIHPEGWGAWQRHGAAAKAAPGPSGGFAWCESCHGTDFAGGIVNTPCARCHGVPAPHPRAPWRGGPQTHATTNTANAPVCAQCHRHAGSGGQPGCFNGTLCHTQRGVHPGGWGDPTSHGPAAKGRPGPSSGFLFCTGCHGSDYRGNGAGVSCFPCHGVDAPHPPSPWRARFTHTTTDQGNAPVCLACHRNAHPPAGAAPGCFNNTLCHPHPPGWASPDLHGAGAKERPSPTRGFPACQSCHGRLFSGSVPGGSCYRSASCHTAPTPHSPAPWRPPGRTHTTTQDGNAGVCGLCHRRPSAPPSLPDNCFNNSLCHTQR
ncbi:MAG TPA: hypothetical protein VI078_07530 [bacterium]